MKFEGTDYSRRTCISITANLLICAIQKSEPDAK